MNRSRLVLRGLAYYWRTNVAVAMGVGTAVAVLAGALLVGDSVRGTLRDLVLSRLGATDVAVVAPGFFRDQLAADVRQDAAFAPAFLDVVPLIMADGFVTAQATGRRAGGVRVYGVDDRFWRFHGVAGLDPESVYVSPALAAETGAAPGEPLLVRVALPSEIPLESLHGRKDDPGRTVRAIVGAVLESDSLGEFSLNPEQGAIKAVFLPLGLLQDGLEVEGRVNALIVSAKAGDAAGSPEIAAIVRRHARLEDAGLRLRELPGTGSLVLESDAGLIGDTHAAAAERVVASEGLRAEPILTYLANTIRTDTREVPYSLVSAMDISAWLPPGASQPADAPPIVLNDWAARDMQARVGDRIVLDYYVWEDPGQLVTRTTEFRLAGVVPIEAWHRDLAPTYPGITDSPTLDDWDPPFPLDLSRVRPVDEEFWETYRATPKAFVPIEVGQRIWGSRYGAVTSIRISAPAQADGPGTAAPGSPLADTLPRLSDDLHAAIDPFEQGWLVREVRAEALSASRGATDFGQYFVYFSFFLVVSALLLAALFFKLGVEQRVREVGLLRAVGFDSALVRRLFMGEAVLLAIAGSALGVIGAVAYAAAIIWALRTHWVDAVGTTALTLHVSPMSLFAGALGGVVAAVGCTWVSLRSLRHISARSLLAGTLPGHETPTGNDLRRSRRWLGASILTAIAALVLLGAGLAGVVAPAGAFFGAGFALLAAGLGVASFFYRRPSQAPILGHGLPALMRLGLRGATFRPGRSVLSMAVIAAATFILIAVDAFRKDGAVEHGPQSGLGGYALLAESLLPIVHDLDTPAGREAANLTSIDSARFQPFRLRPGDDASCLNLYQPTNPRILGATDEFVSAGRFAFRASLAGTEEERANPWLLLHRQFDDGAIPIIADSNSLAYVLHRGIGEDIVIDTGDQPITLRVVAALADSLFQREVIMAEAAFVREFPREEGYRFLLVETPPGRETEVQSAIEQGLGSFGVDAMPAADRLAEFHRVENTYLATFLTLGGLGLLLGTLGLATVIMRNVLERRRELALLSAVGYEQRHFRVMLVAESASLLIGGLLIGGLAAVIATVPAMAERGGQAPLSSTIVLLLFMVLTVGLVATISAARAATLQPLLEALRSE